MGGWGERQALGLSLPAETLPPGEPRSMGSQRCSWVLAGETGRLLRAINKEFMLLSLESNKSLHFKQMNSEFKEDNFGSTGEKKCLNWKGNSREICSENPSI